MPAKLNVVLCWHMHQPEYRDPATDQFQLPWTYLHAIKDYVDMVAHLEMCPEAKAVVNFAPVLIEQINAYAKQIKEYIEFQYPIKDMLLNALVNPKLEHTYEQRCQLIKACLKANEERLINRYSGFSHLVNLAKHIIVRPDSCSYLSEQFIIDMLVWYHLAWMGETVKRNDERLKQLIKKKRNFSISDRKMLLEVIDEQISCVLARYKKLAKRGQIELSITPYAHPMIPLLVDFHVAHDAIPDAVTPDIRYYPGGKERANWHMQEAIEVFTKQFDMAPQGCWPAEGGLCNETIKILENHNIRWTASGEGVLRNSLNHFASAEVADAPDAAHHVYSILNSPLRIFFRDEGLSDDIGFKYSNWHADDAVGDFIHHLENIAEQNDDPNRVVTIILDGENAWEYFPENAFYFISTLYQQLSHHEMIKMTTFSECWANIENYRELPGLSAGSWVYGSFSTWIGNEQKNRGWEMLIDAKNACDQAIQKHAIKGQKLHAILKQLAICEGSDWFWWFGDYNPSDSVADFDRLYRLQLTNLYYLIGSTAPDYLLSSFNLGSHNHVESGGVMKRGQQS